MATNPDNVSKTMGSHPDNVSALPTGTGKGAKSGEPPPHGPLGIKDNAEVIDALEHAVKEVIRLEAERAKINKQLSAVREGVKARSINLKSFAAALAYYKMPDAHREDFDRDYLLVRKASDMPVEPDLFQIEPA